MCGQKQRRWVVLRHSTHSTHTAHTQHTQLTGYSIVASSSMHMPKLYTSTFSSYCSSYSSGAINSGVPSTLCGVVRPRQSVARPRSPI